MFSRRDLFGASALGGLFAFNNSDGEQMSDRAAQDIAGAVKDITTAIRSQRSFDELSPVRQKQLEFLHGQGKFPDFIEVGSDVWLAVHDWHVRHLQPMTLGRDGMGRYTITLMNTTLILRHDAAPNFVGTPYDNR
jgi:hypothetical protein